MASQVIRQQLGRRKTALQDAITNTNELPKFEEITDYDEEEDITEVIFDCVELYEQLDTEIGKINSYLNEWNQLIKNNIDEQKVKDSYFSTYGNLSEILSTAKTCKKKVKETLDCAGTELHKKFPKSSFTIPTLHEWSKSLESCELVTQPDADKTAIAFQLHKPVSSESSSGSKQTTHSDAPAVVRPVAKSSASAFQHSQPDYFESSSGSAPAAVIGPTPPTLGWPTQLHPSTLDPAVQRQPIYPLNTSLLPRTELPRFGGDLLKFREFKEKFESTVGRHPIDIITKFDFLKSSLHGQAERIVSCLPTTERNYSIAWNLLEEHFGGELQLRHHLLCQLQDIPSIRHTTTGEELLEFWSTATALFQQLLISGDNADNTAIALNLERKLPDRILQKLYNEETKIFTASDLLLQISKFAKQEIRISTMQADHRHRSAPRITTMSTINHHQQHPINHQQQHPPNNQQRRTHLETNHQLQNPRSVNNSRHPQHPTPCAFCLPEAQHRHWKCPKYTTAESRMRRAEELKLCLACLRTGHSLMDCQWKERKCFVCKNYHKANSAVCNRTFGSNAPANNRNFSSSGQPSRRQYSSSSQLRRSGNPNHNRPFWTSNTNAAIASESPTHQDTTMIAFNYMASLPETTEIAHLQPEIHPDLQPPPNDDEDLMDAMRTALHATPRSTPPQRKPIMMLTKQVEVRNNEGKLVPATLFVDPGSNKSYISSKLSAKLKLEPVGEEALQIQTFGSNEGRRMSSKKYNVTIECSGQRFEIPLSQVSLISSSVATAAPLDNLTLEQFVNTEDFEVQRDHVEPDILIGLDTSSLILGNQTIRVLPNGLQLYSTQIGTFIGGTEAEVRQPTTLDQMEINYPTLRHQPTGLLAIDCDSEHQQLSNLLERFWSLEAMGISDDLTMSDDDRAMKYFNNTVERQSDGRFSVRLPYSEDPKKLLSNRHIAHFRLKSTLANLKKTDGLLKRYDDTIRDQLRRGYIEEVDEKKPPDGEIVHYIPHHCVLSGNKKMRIVYDGSAQASKADKSINSMLYTGAPMLPLLNGILVRARLKPILIVSDLEKAFLQLHLHINDRDATRFLWIDDTDDQHPRTICYRFCRVPFGLRSSPFSLNATLNLFLSKSSNSYAEKILQDLYVDNSFMGVETVKEGQDFYKQSKKLFQEACFNLCQFASNNKELNNFMSRMEGIPEEPADQKLLGIPWNTSSDEIIMKLPPPPIGLLTKRSILQMTASIYDPTGLITPASLFGKVFFQSLWTTSRSWDQPLSETENAEWIEILQKWSGMPIKLPRQYFANTKIDDIYELHIFCDASITAYGAAGYIRRTNGSEAESRLVYSKCRIAPLKKKLTIPQLEMMGIVVAANIKTFLVAELKIKFNSINIWSDSQCCIDAIKSRKGTIFMRNRIDTFKKSTPDAHLRHVKGTENPADILSRGSTFDDLRTNKLWWNGPQFLQDATTTFGPKIEEDTSELQEDPVTLLSITKPTPIIDVNKFSRFHKLIRLLMTIFQFLNGGKGCRLDYANKARRAAFKMAQDESPPDNSTIATLRLRKIENLWIFDGRISNQPLIFLPRGKIAELFVHQLHEVNHHSSTNFTLTELRRTTWIPKGRQFVKKVINRCLQCQRQKAAPFKQPEFPPFPTKRLEVSAPFTYIGMDYAGPWNVKQDDNIVKTWLLIFTCLSTRFTHCELVRDMTTNTLLLALRRLSSKFGTPRWINCDNATQFTALNEIFNHILSQRETALNSTTMPKIHFNPALSPWSGGHYERLIAVLKQSLVKAGTTRSLMSFEELRTLLDECCHIVNRRPITFVPSGDDEMPLKPIDLVMPRVSQSSILLADQTLNIDDLPSLQSSILDQWISLSSLSDYFVRRWKMEYPQLLRERFQFEHKQKSTSEIPRPTIGDIVMFEAPTSKLSWPIGRIVEVQERSVKLKRADTGRIVERPYCQVYPLEASKNAVADEPTSQADPPTAPVPENPTEPPPTQPKHPMIIRPRKLLKNTTTLTILAAIICLSCCSASTPSTSTSTISSTTTTDSTIPTNIFNINLSIPTTDDIIYTCKIIVIAAMLMLLINMIHLCQGIFMLLKLIGKAVWKIVWLPIYILKLIKDCFLNMCRRSTRKGRRKYKSIIALLLLIGLIRLVQPCEDLASISAKDRTCTTSEDGSRCTTNSIIQFSMPSSKSTRCIKIEDSEAKEVVSEIKIHIEAVTSRCSRRSIYYTRDHFLDYTYSHRCYLAGSCEKRACNAVKIDEDLPEIENSAKKSPGFTRCFAGCGWLSCNACAMPHPSCLFYRIYATPQSSEAYEVFQCLFWQPIVVGSITLNGTSHKIRLEPGIKTKLPFNISVTAISYSLPPNSLLHATFVEKKTAEPTFGFHMADPSPPGAPIEGTLGSLQCPSKQDAEKFNCKFSENACHCVGQGTYVKCHCNTFQISEMMKRSPIPTSTENLDITVFNGNLFASTKTSASVQIQLEMANSTFYKHVIDEWCNADEEVIEVRGCHSCSSGAKIQLSCSSRSRTVLSAKLSCSDSSHPIVCGNRHPNNIQINFHTSSVNINCSVSCGSKQTYVVLNGELEYTPEMNLTGSHAAVYEKTFGIDLGIFNPLASIRSLFDRVVDSFTTVFLVILFVLILVCALKLLATKYPPLRFLFPTRRYRARF